MLRPIFKHRITCLLILCLGAPLRAGEDPYEGITIHELKNGLTVVLAPSGDARTIEVEARVHTGWTAETRRNAGAAHLLEHALFRDDRLGKDQSYAQHIKEKAAGYANGSTSWKSTSFTASVPSLKGAWVLNEFARMLFNRSFTQDQVDKSAAEVLLELGEEKNFFQSLLGFLIPFEWETPDFFESEFGFDHKSAPDEKVRKNTKRLTALDVQEFYDRYYGPSNIVLFYAGPFKVKETMQFLSDTFEAFPGKPREKTKGVVAHPRRHPYLRSQVATRDAWISIGTKFWDIEAQDEMVLRSYFESLSHRLMKKLRNESAETYSVDATVWTDEGRFGYATLSLETPLQRFEKNLAQIEGQIRHETEEGKFTDEEIAEAKAMSLDSVKLLERGSDTMARLANQYFDFRINYDTEKTPYQVLNAIPPDEFRARLTKLFAPERRYLALVEPPILFRGEYVPLALLTLLLTIALCRSMSLKPFDHTAIRYVRKIKYGAGSILVYTIAVLALIWCSMRLGFGVHRVLLYWPWFQSSYVLSEYLEGALLVALLTLVLGSFLSFLPRKLILTRDSILLKSVSYRSREFPLSAFLHLCVMRPHEFFKRRLWERKLRWHHWALWRRGVLMELQGRRAYFLWFKQPDKVVDEFHSAMQGEAPTVPKVMGPPPLPPRQISSK